MNTTEERTFNPSSHIIQISTNAGKKDYLPCAWRLVWLRSVCPDAEIMTELLHLDLDKEVEHKTTQWNDELKRYEKVTLHGRGVAVFKATVKLPSGAVATGTKQENGAAFSDWLEKAETGAIGRALAGLGYGTQFTGDELDEDSDRIADAPVSRGQAPARESKPLEGAITSQQTSAILSMLGKLGRKETPDLSNLSAQEAADEIGRLSAEWRKVQQKAS